MQRLRSHSVRGEASSAPDLPALIHDVIRGRAAFRSRTSASARYQHVTASFSPQKDQVWSSITRDASAEGTAFANKLVRRPELRRPRSSFSPASSSRQDERTRSAWSLCSFLPTAIKGRVGLITACCRGNRAGPPRCLTVIEPTFNFAPGGAFPYAVAGPGGVLPGAGRATSARPVTLKASRCLKAQTGSIGRGCSSHSRSQPLSL